MLVHALSAPLCVATHAVGISREISSRGIRGRTEPWLSRCLASRPIASCGRLRISTPGSRARAPAADGSCTELTRQARPCPYLHPEPKLQRARVWVYSAERVASAQTADASLSSATVECHFRTLVDLMLGHYMLTRGGDRCSAEILDLLMFCLEASQAQGGLLLPPPPLRHTAAAPLSLADVDSSRYTSAQASIAPTPSARSPSLSPLPAALKLAPKLEPALKHRMCRARVGNGHGWILEVDERTVPPASKNLAKPLNQLYKCRRGYTINIYTELD
ncbi:uncharacterized protein BDR25DRAFT_348681 [Lindgomyces ingoldianus]|uniref:Uncharacterized protein n=1 Tax=Lindgomyces ingoldianus TaxID=673940 RepID=A0ACB6RHZ9_9PLEO|nr:uncharacterized protein BDR25DRAFT_348681 [Lindgomyces ingoldianus]KAF2478403.1 hypothetical protein BDR25DRAFT_348681 [Lindgomyces ingoldianus]